MNAWYNSGDCRALRIALGKGHQRGARGRARDAGVGIPKNPHVLEIVQEAIVRIDI